MTDVLKPQKITHPKEPRRWRRANAIEWRGVETDGYIYHAPLIKKISKRGEVHWITSSKENKIRSSVNKEITKSIREKDKHSAKES